MPNATVTTLTTLFRRVSLNTWLQLITLTTAFIVVYFQIILNLINDWKIDDNFSHGFFVPFISAFMIWQNKQQFSAIDIKPNYLGYLVLLVGMGLFIVGNIGAELFTMRFSIIIALLGIVLLSFGTEVLKKTYVPICYLILMIPIPSIIWNKIAFPLQLFAARLSTEIISLVQIPVFREGNIIHLANTSLQVVDACSGLRSLTTMIALSGAFAYISKLKNTGKWILFFSSIPIAIAVNIVRLTITAILARYIGPEIAQGFLHELSGIIIFIVALVLLYLTYYLLSRIPLFNSTSN